MLHEDESLLVVDKPGGIALLKDRQDPVCLWEQLRDRYGKLYLVHRLDKGTSGVLVLAKSQAVQTRLTRAFEQRTVSKHYLAWVDGSLPIGDTSIADLPLCRGRKSRYRLAGERVRIELTRRCFTVPQDREGVAAITRFRGLRQHGGRTLVAAKPLTGRTHQLRVHLAWLGWPISGDHLYNPRSRGAPPGDLRLHCAKLVLPVGRFRAALPAAWDF